MAEKTTRKTSFEQSVAKLEKIVAQMEQGDLPLEKTIALYEQGVKLTKDCAAELEKAKLKIEELKVEQADE